MTVGELRTFLAPLPNEYKVYIQRGLEPPIAASDAINDGEEFKSVTICSPYTKPEDYDNDEE